ncbi:MAG: family 10 glycosylhydrolase [Proteobacteria bacterium]|nr:family 10 glycosylhydrolase [Pseudomonadota bacterium]
MCTRWSCLPLLLALIACGDPVPPPAPAPEDAPAQPSGVRRGLWVLAEGAERALESEAGIETLIERATELGVSDVFVQVYRGGRSWFPSDYADDAPYREIAATQDEPPLDRLLRLAHARGMRVHAWFNCLRLASNRNAPLLERVGPQAVLVDRQGHSLLDYPDGRIPAPDGNYFRLGTPGLWLDPAIPEVVEYLERTLDDLIAAAPGLDGLHLDIIRFPLALPFAPGSRFELGVDFGYAPESRRRFEEESGKPFAPGSAWDAFRRARVGEVVRRLSERVPESWEMSAAVLSHADRAYYVAMQDWRHWLEQGWLDFAVAMAYTRDHAMLRYLAHSLSGGVAGERIWLGLGAWLFLDRPQEIVRQIELALEPEPAGWVLFSYDSLMQAPASLDAIRGAIGGDAAPGP